MGRKKGKQCGEFQRKSQNAANRHLLYVDNASEANGYRNPVTGFRGGGYRNTFSDDGGGHGGQWCGRGGRGGGGGGGKWSSIFSQSRASQGANNIIRGSDRRNSNSTTAATIGLSRLRFLLEERRIDDRVHDREFRLRLHRTRMRESHLAGSNIASHSGGMARSGRQYAVASQVKGDLEEVARHEPGWLLRYFDNNPGGSTVKKAKEECNQQCRFEQTTTKSEMPSLQILAAEVLASHLQAYIETCGHVFVGECLKSVHADLVSKLSISLAKSNSISDGIVKSFAHAGAVNGLVLRGPMREVYDRDEERDDSTTHYLTDEGLLSLCPRLLPAVECPTQNFVHGTVEDNGNNNDEGDEVDSDEDDDSVDDWEKLDVDSDLTSRMAGCFHLKRLELIDLPLAPIHNASDKRISGISLGVLRQVFKSCPSITHLSLTGCFYNWEEVEYASSSLQIDESENVSLLLCGASYEKGVMSNMINEFQKLDDTNCRDGRGISQLFLDHIFRLCKRGYESSKNDVLGLDTLLPELQVLDVSHCSWVTPSIIFRFALQCWKRAYFSQARLEERDFEFDWMDRTIHAEGSNAIFDDWKDEFLSNHSYRRRIPQISTTLHYLNVLGCIGLASSDTLSQLRNSQFVRQRVEEWNKYGIFHGINLTAECHRRED